MVCCLAGYLIWSLGLTSSVMQITNATAKATYGEVNASLKEKGLDLERVLDGSVFIEAWEKLQSKTSGVPIVIKEKEIEMEPVSGSKKRE